MNRRRLLKTLFCSSVSLGLNLQTRSFGADKEKIDVTDFNFFALGDFGSGFPSQEAVAKGMMTYAKNRNLIPDALLMLGDNFYGPMPGGIDCPRWKSGFTDMYPASAFPNACWAVLGNHDYHDHPDGQHIQLDYAKHHKDTTRWKMPNEFYRFDFPEKDSQITFLVIDTNWKSVNGNVHHDSRNCWISEEKQAQQLEWLKRELGSKRARFTIVIGHHPLYSDGSHGDTPALIEQLGPLFEQHGVHLYLCGHDHDLQHLELESRRTSFVISGGGGARVRPTEKLRAGNTKHAVYGFSHLFFKDNRLFVKHIDPNGKTLHAFSKGANFDFKVEHDV